MIDFSKAPEGATHYMGSGLEVRWFRHNGILWQISRGEGDWSGTFIQDRDVTPIPKKKLLENELNKLGIISYRHGDKMKDTYLGDDVKRVTQDFTTQINYPSSSIKNKDGVVNHLTDRELMLCEQVVRMCRGEESQFKDSEEGWVDALRVTMSIHHEYRAKPKKELVVPWEWLDDDVCAIDISPTGKCFAIIEDEECYPLPIKLDLEGVKIPVIVKRPKS